MIQYLLTLLLITGHVVDAKYLLYLNSQHNVIPEPALLSDITHVTLAFMSPAIFNQANKPKSFPLFTTVEEVRSRFPPGITVMIAIGGWGDTEGFSIGAVSDVSRALFAQNVKEMLDVTGADGVDIDWEYPGGNGEDYKQHPNSEKAWEIDAYPELLRVIRSAIGNERLISAAIPGLPRDMMAFTEANIKLIDQYIDFFNVMTYDMMNRRDSITKHHTGVELSLNTIDTYFQNGISSKKMNLGFAFYLRWFKTDPHGGCDKNPVGCKTVLMEDPITGEDLGQSGAFSWHDTVPKNLQSSFDRAMVYGTYDLVHGGHYYWDSKENIWWTWDNPSAISEKFPAIIAKKNLGGVFAWALGEDAPEFRHLKALTDSRQNFLKAHAPDEL